MDVVTVGDAARLVRAARVKKGLSQAEAAAAGGVSRQWLVRVEAGHDGAELVRVLRVLEVLGVRLHDGGLAGQSVRSADTSSGGPGTGVDLDDVLARFGG